MSRSILLVSAVCALLLSGLPAAAAAPAEHTLTLPNGLRIVVHEDHRAPTAVVQVWYRVGSIDESDGTSGLAHVLEHMMFKGTPSVPAGAFSKTIARVGGRDNAFTGTEHTAYFEQIHRDQLELALRMEADRMANLSFRDSDFASEIKVVMEERRLRTDDQPRAMLDEQLAATVFQSNPYRRPVVGWMDDLQHLTANDARDWYHRWYAPNNACLVVAGDVQAAEVFRLARRHFGPLARRPLPPRRPQLEAEPLGARRIVVKVPATVPVLAIGWPAPALRDAERDWQPYALDLLAAVLAGDTGRFADQLVRGRQVAVSADAGFDDLRRGPGLFTVEAAPVAGHSIAELEQAVLDEIRRVQDQGVSSEELARVRTQVVAAQVYGRDSVFFQAMQIGTYDTLGLPWQEVDRVPERLARITPEQVQEVARRYLQPDRSTVAVLDPQPLPAGAPAPDPLAGPVRGLENHHAP
ncbi:MAG: insulinase family protein [Pseudomonadota bacterium]|nr:insulinase family protein [Pseudomonadota bacterium]